MLRTVEENVATPFEAVADAPEAMEPGPVATVRLIMSLLPALEPVSTLPKVSSTETANEVRLDPAVPAVGGAVEKTTLLGAAGVTVTTGLLARFTALPPPELDAAVKVGVPAVVRGSDLVPGYSVVDREACPIGTRLGHSDRPRTGAGGDG